MEILIDSGRDKWIEICQVRGMLIIYTVVFWMGIEQVICTAAEDESANMTQDSATLCSPLAVNSSLWIELDVLTS